MSTCLTLELLQVSYIGDLPGGGERRDRVEEIVRKQTII